MSATPTAPTVTSYVKGRLPYWTRRWLWTTAFLVVVSSSFRLREAGWEFGWRAVGVVAAAFGIAFAAAMLATVASLAVGGALHTRGIELPEWLTRRRGE